MANKFKLLFHKVKHQGKKNSSMEDFVSGSDYATPSSTESLSADPSKEHSLGLGRFPLRHRYFLISILVVITMFFAFWLIKGLSSSDATVNSVKQNQVQVKPVKSDHTKKLAAHQPKPRQTVSQQRSNVPLPRAQRKTLAMSFDQITTASPSKAASRAIKSGHQLPPKSATSNVARSDMSASLSQKEGIKHTNGNSKVVKQNKRAPIVIKHDPLIEKNLSIEHVFKKANHYYTVRDYSRALALLSLNQPSVHHYPEYYGLLSLLYLKNNQIVLASSLYESLLKAYPNDSKWWVGLGLSLEMQGPAYYHDARSSFEKAIEVKGLSPEEEAYVKYQIKNLGGI